MFELRAREQRAAGDLDGAISTMRDAINQRLVPSKSVSTARSCVIYNSFANMAVRRPIVWMRCWMPGRESLAASRDIGQSGVRRSDHLG